MFRSRILPAIVTVWGAAVLLRLLVRGTTGNGAYSAGGYFAGALAVVMVVAGVRALLKARRS
ncbi:MAG: hypothetical protein QOJ12_2885 [Thermoleophilales bacterium]|jgi:hypothetical protein|nr:hypothetical protein [Thermoleophilales bacterium]